MKIACPTSPRRTFGARRFAIIGRLLLAAHDPSRIRLERKENIA